MLLEEEHYKLVLILGVLLLSSLIALSLILFSVETYIQGQAQSQKILIDLEEREFSQLKTLEEEVASFNRELSNLNSFYQNQIYLTSLFERISANLPEGIYLTSFSYRKRDSEVTLKGFCPTIEILSEFRGNLKKEKQFENIYFPLSNWVKPRDISFNVTFTWSP